MQQPIHCLNNQTLILKRTTQAHWQMFYNTFDLLWEILDIKLHYFFFPARFPRSHHSVVWFIYLFILFALHLLLLYIHSASACSSLLFICYILEWDRHVTHLEYNCFFSGTWFTGSKELCWKTHKPCSIQVFLSISYYIHPYVWGIKGHITPATLGTSHLVNDSECADSCPGIQRCF